jgi:two-component system CheB/CheR fusion protein
MKNLIESTRIATLFLDAGMRITGFTPAITGVFHLRDSDRGRPISDITSLLNYDRLAEDVRTVLRQLTVLEREVEVTAGGNCFLMHIRPYLTVDRVVDGVVITFVDITERRRTEATLREHAALVEFAADGLIGIGLDGKVRTWNPGAERLLGHPAVAAIGQPLDFLYAAGHNDRKAASIARALAGRVATPIETVLCGRDGLPLDVELSAVPIRAPDGSVSGAAVTVHNIAERKQAEAQRSLLLRELSHRVKNALATAQALAMETLRTAPSLEAFRDSFVERLLGLARTHDLLTRGEWQDALLSAVLEAELAPYQGAERPRWTAHGPAVLLSPNAALALGMAFHELAINAAKYGALSVPGGQVDVRWRTRKVAEGRRLLLSWIESGGPPVTPPRRQGFGTRLIGDGLGFELDGEAKLEFPPQGVRCTIDIPLPMEPGSP